MIYDFFRYDLPRFLTNFWAYKDILWYDKDYDYLYLCLMLNRKFSRMADHFQRSQVTVSWEKNVKDLRICANLCKRLKEDHYKFKQMINNVPDNDKKLLGKIVGRRLNNWWD